MVIRSPLTLYTRHFLVGEVPMCIDPTASLFETTACAWLSRISRCSNATKFEASWDDMIGKVKDGWRKNNGCVCREEKKPFKNVFLCSINYFYAFNKLLFLYLIFLVNVNVNSISILDIKDTSTLHYIARFITAFHKFPSILFLISAVR